MSADAITKRWTARLRIRKNLLAKAEQELAEASRDERPAAKAKVAKRREQVAFAQRVLDRHAVPKLTARERAVRAAMLGVKHRDKISYTQSAAPRWDGITRGCRAYRDQFPRSADCSSFVTWCLWDALGGPRAGEDRVNGQGWTQGWTGTQSTHGRVVSRAAARPGDLVFYRGANGAIDHVTILVAPDKAVSHGSDPGPQVVRPDYRPIAEIRSYLP